MTIIFLIAASAMLWLEQTLTGDAVLVVAQAGTPPDEVTQSDAGGDASESSATEIEELSAEEIEEELKRAQELLDDPDAPKEFVQAKPLPADIAIDLPSDI